MARSSSTAGWICDFTRALASKGNSPSNTKLPSSAGENTSRTLPSVASCVPALTYTAVPASMPPETSAMTLNMLNVQIEPSTIAGPSAGLRWGRVISLNRCQLDAPSTSAASSSSLGIDSSAPNATTIMNGKPSQVLVATLAENALAHDENHDTRSSPSPDRIEFTAPYSPANMPFQISAVM